MAENDFPRLLYKKSESGNAQPIWGLGTFDVLEAADQAIVDAALADGWTLSPADEPIAPKTSRAKAAAADLPPAPAADPQPEPAPAGEAPQG